MIQANGLPEDGLRRYQDYYHRVCPRLRGSRVGEVDYDYKSSAKRRWIATSSTRTSSLPTGSALRLHDRAGRRGRLGCRGGAPQPSTGPCGQGRPGSARCCGVPRAPRAPVAHAAGRPRGAGAFLRGRAGPAAAGSDSTRSSRARRIRQSRGARAAEAERQRAGDGGQAAFGARSHESRPARASGGFCRRRSRLASRRRHGGPPRRGGSSAVRARDRIARRAGWFRHPVRGGGSQPSTTAWAASQPTPPSPSSRRTSRRRTAPRRIAAASTRRARSPCARRTSTTTWSSRVRAACSTRPRRTLAWRRCRRTPPSLALRPIRLAPIPPGPPPASRHELPPVIRGQPLAGFDRGPRRAGRSRFLPLHGPPPGSGHRLGRRPPRPRAGSASRACSDAAAPCRTPRATTAVLRA